MKSPNDLFQMSPECVLFTCVAGSRAYGTHAHESDEDTRGIYAVRADRYLDLDTPPPQLALNEWLNSPIVYRESEGLRCQLQALIPAFFNPIAAVHHYLSMARAALDSREVGGVISTEKLFYALRALFACRWIERTNSQPPTEFERLVSFVANEIEKSWITDLLQKKAQGSEGDWTLVTQQLMDAYTSELTGLDTTRTSRQTKAGHEPLDEILRQWTV